MLLLPLLLTLLAAPAQSGGEDAAEPAPPISAFTLPLYLDDLPPEVRSLRLIHIVHADVPNAARNVTRTHAEALELARHVAASLRAGEDFARLAREYSSGPNATTGGVLGTFPPGLLATQMDDFLFQAEVGEISDPIDIENGIHVAQRIDTYAATRHIAIHDASPAGKARAEAALARIRAGEDFATVAREESDGPETRARGGLFTLFERGASDRLLKQAAFEARVGETVGPIETPIGYHLIQRVPVDGHPEDLRETTLVRVRAILISHDNTPLGGISAQRPMEDAERLANEIRDRIRSGEDMAELARHFNDDIGGKERDGDLGWLHRNHPKGAPFLAQCFTIEPGEVLGPILTNVGYAVVRREM
jgi:parvulin-like peptidyl-prolyl isomerase